MPTFAHALVAVIGSGAAQILMGLFLQNTLKHIKVGRHALHELTTNKVFRKFDSPGMAYVAGGAPFVHALLLCFALWILDIRRPVYPGAIHPTHMLATPQTRLTGPTCVL